MSLPVKHVAVCTLISSALLLGACSKDGDGDNQWVTESIYNGDDPVSKPQVAQAGNGDLIVIWQELESDTIQADTALNDAHTGVGYETHDFSHYFQCQRTNIWIRRYDASADSWNSASLLQTGKWRKTLTYILETGKTEYELDEVVAPTLDSGATIAVDGNGNALAMWSQDQVDDCNATPTSSFKPVLYSASYNASTNTWATPSTVQINSNDVTAVQSIQIKLNSSGAGLVAWEQIQDDSVNYGAQQQQTIYAAAYSSSTLGTPVRINDSSTSNGYDLVAVASQPALAINSNGDGVIVWRHTPRKSALTDEPVNEVRAKRYTSSSDTWGSSLTLGSGTARTADFTASSSVEKPVVALDDNGLVWAAWIDVSQVDNADGSVTALFAKVMANSVSSADVIGTAASLQTNDANTTENETQFSQSAVSIAIDGNSNAMAAWIQHRTSGLNNVWNNNATDQLRVAFHQSGSWSNAVTLDSGSRLDAFSPQVVRLNTDRFTLAWTQINDPRDKSHYSVNVRSIIDSSGWTDKEVVGSTKDPYSIQLSSNGQGRASVVWYSDGNVAAATMQ